MFAQGEIRNSKLCFMKRSAQLIELPMKTKTKTKQKKKKKKKNR
jgi:hypothetical protein